MHETDLIACVLIDPTKLDELDISGLHFRDQDLGSLFDGLRILRDDKFPSHDIAALIPQLGKMQSIPQDVREPKYLAELFRSGANAASAAYYASRIREAYEIEKLRDTLRSALEQLDQHNASASATAKWIDAHVSTHHNSQTKPRTVKQIYDAVIAELDAPREDSGGLMIGFPSHDEINGGWQPGELVILAARPGVGKTSLGVQIAWHQARKNRSAAIVSLEMTGEEVVKRILSSEAEVDSRVLRKRELTRDQRLNILASGDRFEDASLTIWDPPRTTMTEIRAFARRQRATRKLHLLVVDYLGLIRPRDSRKQRYEQVQDDTGELKALAKELGCPVLCLCQLNREADKDKPRLSHLRESGSIEQDADCVLFLHRNKDKNLTELIIAKNRHGRTGFIELDFSDRTTAFSERIPEATECRNYDSCFETYSQGEEF